MTARRALGVCVRVDRLRPLLEALEAAGVNLQTVTPMAMLVAQAVAASDNPTLVLIGEGAFVDVVALEHRKPIAWGFSGDAAGDVQLQIGPGFQATVRRRSSSLPEHRLSVAAASIKRRRNWR